VSDMLQERKEVLKKWSFALPLTMVKFLI